MRVTVFRHVPPLIVGTVGVVLDHDFDACEERLDALEASGVVVERLEPNDVGSEIATRPVVKRLIATEGERAFPSWWSTARSWRREGIRPESSGRTQSAPAGALSSPPRRISPPGRDVVMEEPALIGLGNLPLYFRRRYFVPDASLGSAAANGRPSTHGSVP